MPDVENDYLTAFILDGVTVATVPTIIPLPLCKGMQVTIHGKEGQTFEVVEWSIHLGHPDEDAGIRVILREQTR